MVNDARRPPRTRPPPPWSSPWEAAILVARGYTARTGVVVALVVGTVLSAINEGSDLAADRLGLATWLRIGGNYLVPFLVASIGYLVPFRRPRRHD